MAIYTQIKSFNQKIAHLNKYLSQFIFRFWKTLSKLILKKRGKPVDYFSIHQQNWSETYKKTQNQCFYYDFSLCRNIQVAMQIDLIWGNASLCYLCLINRKTADGAVE